MKTSLSLVLAGAALTLLGMTDGVGAQVRCETATGVNHCGVFSAGRITPNFQTNRFVIDHEPGLGQHHAYVNLYCHSAGVIKRIFKSLVNVPPGTSITKACGVAPFQSTPFIFNSMCGDLASCS